MIVEETITINDIEFKKTYSNENKFIRKVGTNEIYKEAVDILDSTYEYIETEQEIIKVN